MNGRYARRDTNPLAGSPSPVMDADQTMKLGSAAWLAHVAAEVDAWPALDDETWTQLSALLATSSTGVGGNHRAGSTPDAA